MTTKLLAVDDSKTMRRVLEITFSGDEFQTTIASGSQQALSALKADPPQVAVIDAHLGNESGYDLCRAIKTAAPSTRVLMLSSKQRPYDEARGKSAGADGFFDKPFDSTKMIARVNQEVASAGPPAVRAPAPVAAPEAPAPRSAPASVGSVGLGSVRLGSAGLGSAAMSSAGTGSAGMGSAAAVEPLGRRPVAPLPRTSASPPRTSLSGESAGPAMAAVAPVSQASTGQASTGQASTGQGSAGPRSAAAPQPVARAAASAARPAVGVPGNLGDRLAGLGLTADQVQSVLALSRDVVEQVVWEVVPALAEAMIKEEIARLTAE